MSLFPKRFIKISLLIVLEIVPKLTDFPRGPHYKSIIVFSLYRVRNSGVRYSNVEQMMIKFLKKTTKKRMQNNPHVCLVCGSVLARGNLSYKQRHWNQMRKDEKHKSFQKLIVPQDHIDAQKL